MCQIQIKKQKLNVPKYKVKDEEPKELPLSYFDGINEFRNILSSYMTDVG